MNKDILVNAAESCKYCYLSSVNSQPSGADSRMLEARYYVRNGLSSTDKTEAGYRDEMARLCEECRKDGRPGQKIRNYMLEKGILKGTDFIDI